MMSFEWKEKAECERISQGGKNAKESDELDQIYKQNTE
jgi:hypothetical protein